MNISVPISNENTDYRMMALNYQNVLGRKSEEESG